MKDKDGQTMITWKVRKQYQMELLGKNSATKNKMQ